MGSIYLIFHAKGTIINEIRQQEILQYFRLRDIRQRRAAMSQTEIAYQNKDIISKFLAENFKGKTFRVYGLKLPKVKRVLPTNIPTVKANELRLDNLFELADGSMALVDYESDYDKKDKIKYLNYVTGIANRYLQENKECPPIHMIVIYTGDIDRKKVSAKYDIGAVRIKLETAFLSELDSKRIFDRLKKKVAKNQLLNDEELMQFIMLPLAYRTKKEKQQKVRETVELAAKIQDKNQQIFTLAGILVFTDKVIDKETASKIRRVIEMTQVAQIFEEEKQQALEQAAQSYEARMTQAAQSYEEEKQQALTQAAQSYEEEKRKALTQVKNTYEEENRRVVIRMIKKDYSTEEIVSLLSGYSQNDVEKLRNELSQDNVSKQEW